MTNKAGARTYTSQDVMEIGGISARQLQWWDEQEVVSPRHECHKRLYSQAEAVLVAVIADLRRKGVALRNIRYILRRLNHGIGDRIADERQEWYIATDCRTIHWLNSKERVVALLLSASEPIYVVSLSDQVRKVLG